MKLGVSVVLYACIFTFVGLPILGFSAVPATSNGTRVSIIYVYPVFPDSYIRITVRINNTGLGPIWVAKVLLSFDWNPKILYGYLGQMREIKKGSYTDFPIDVYIPRDTSSDTEHSLHVYVESVELTERELRGVLFYVPFGLRVSRPMTVITKEVTVTVSTQITAESMRTIFTQAPPTAESGFRPEWIWGILGSAAAIAAVVVSYFQFYLPWREKKREKIEGKLKDVYFPLYRLLERAKNGGEEGRVHVRKAKGREGPWNYVLNESEIDDVRRLITQISIDIDSSVLGKLSDELDKSDWRVPLLGVNWFKFSDNAFDPFLKSAEDKCKELRGKLQKRWNTFKK